MVVIRNRPLAPFQRFEKLFEIKGDGLPGEEPDEVLVLSVLNVESEILELIWKPGVHSPRFLLVTYTHAKKSYKSSYVHHN